MMLRPSPLGSFIPSPYAEEIAVAQEATGGSGAGAAAAAGPAAWAAAAAVSRVWRGYEESSLGVYKDEASGQLAQEPVSPFNASVRTLGDTRRYSKTTGTPANQQIGHRPPTHPLTHPLGTAVCAGNEGRGGGTAGGGGGGRGGAALGEGWRGRCRPGSLFWRRGGTITIAINIRGRYECE